MLIRYSTLKAIKAGEVTLQFRRWLRPTVKTGGRLRTRIGELEIETVEKVSLRSITATEARQAGFDTKSALLEELREREGDYYRISVRFAGADSRIALREDSDLSDAELSALLEKLARMDARTSTGPWTKRVLSIIAKHPEVVSTELAAKLKVERMWLKPQVRKAEKPWLDYQLRGWLSRFSAWRSCVAGDELTLLR